MEKIMSLSSVFFLIWLVYFHTVVVLSFTYDYVAGPWRQSNNHVDVVSTLSRRRLDSHRLINPSSSRQRHPAPYTTHTLAHTRIVTVYGQAIIISMYECQRVVRNQRFPNTRVVERFLCVSHVPLLFHPIL